MWGKLFRLDEEERKIAGLNRAFPHTACLVLMLHGPSMCQRDWQLYDDSQGRSGIKLLAKLDGKDGRTGAF